MFKVRHLSMGTFEGKFWRARLVNELGPERTAMLFPGYQTSHLLIVPPGTAYHGPGANGLAELSSAAEGISWLNETDAGSNNWVIAGSRTASGKPLLAGDPHRALDTPNVYYQNHISCPEFDVIGLSFPGCPGFPHFGHNAYVAWGVTHAGADYQDLYVERFKNDGPLLYQFKGEWREAEVRHELIAVRGGQPVELDVTVTHHGPIIVGRPTQGHGIAFRYTSTAEPNRGFECLLQMLKAASADELEESQREWVDPCNNLVYADVRGSIGYLNRGKVPIRSMTNAWLPVPGWTGEHEWEGVIPFEQLPRVREPDTGYIVTANNRIVGEGYPYYISLDSAPEFRARRITHRLLQLSRATVADMAAIHADKASIPAKVYTSLLAHAQPQAELTRKAKEKLNTWDGTMAPDGVAPTVYSAFRDRLDRMLWEHSLGAPLLQETINGAARGGQVHLRRLSALFLNMAQESDTSLLPPGADWETLLSQALAEGVAYLQTRLGDDLDSWHWGTLHSTKPQHALSPSFPELAGLLDPPSMPLGGDGDTPQAGSYLPGDLFTITGLSVARYAMDLGDWSNCQWIIPLGASGHPGSPHYADQTPIWAEVKMVPMLYDWARIAAEAESKQKLTTAPDSERRPKG